MSSAIHARPADESHPARDAERTLRAALAGAVAAAAALGASELVAGLLPGAPSMVAAVGGAVIDLQPPGAKDVVVALFGQADKLALEVTVVVAALAIGALLGLVGLRRPRLATAGFLVAGGMGLVAAAQDPQTSVALAAIPAGVAAATGPIVLGWLAPPPAGDTSAADPAATMPNWSRRAFLVRAAGVGAASVAAGAMGRMLLQADEAAPAPPGGYPAPTSAATIPSGAELDVPGITPLVVANDDFYRIDTALLVPRVDVATWRLDVTGMVDRPTSLTFDELLGLPMIEQYVTIACVSNEVGGGLVGNAKWTGVRLREVLDLAGVQPAASQLVGRSVDGFTAGMPTAWVMDRAREPLIAVRMNDAPLPTTHGYPARLIVPGLYGYVSATKWLTELELTTLEAFDAYWVPLGWAKEAPILTQSRIDVPRFGQSLDLAAPIAVAGVAWAPDRGVSRVELAIDGVWRDARLSVPITGATWVQWVYEWEGATPGRHELRVRATDGTGAVQPEGPTPPAPDGARGYHTVSVTV